MLNDTTTKAKSYRRRALLITGVAMVVVYILWNIPQLSPVLYPLTLFTTFVHEMGHAVATLITGGDVVAFSVSLDGSGFITRRGGADWIIGPAGYLGAALFGSGLFFLVNRIPRMTNGIAVVIGVGLALLTVVFSSGNLLALLIGVGMGMALMALGLKASPLITMLVLNVLAVSTALEAFFDLQYLMFVTTANQEIANDAVNFSERVTPLIPPNVIAVTWALMALVMFGMALYFGAWQPLRNEIDETYNSVVNRNRL